MPALGQAPVGGGDLLAGGAGRDARGRRRGPRSRAHRRADLDRERRVVGVRQRAPVDPRASHGGRCGYARAMRGGIDLGGTKIQAVIVDADHEVRGETRVPTPTSGGPSDVAAAMVGALQQAAEAAGVQTAELEGVGVGSPGDVDGKKGTVTSARNLPDWEGSFPLADELSRPSGRASPSATTSRWRPTPRRCWAPGARTARCWACSGAPASAAASSSTGARGSAAAPPARSATSSSSATARAARAGASGCMEAYAGRGAMELRARDAPEEAATRRTSSTSCATAAAIGSRAASGRAPWTATTSSPSSSWTTRSPPLARASRRCRTCSTSMRSSSAAAWDPARRALRPAHPRRHAPPPLRRRRPARGARRRAGRPGRRHRRIAAGQRLDLAASTPQKRGPHVSGQPARGAGGHPR